MHRRLNSRALLELPRRLFEQTTEQRRRRLEEELDRATNARRRQLVRRQLERLRALQVRYRDEEMSAWMI